MKAEATPSGPRDAKIIIVGEALGEQEQMSGVPFIGASGQELTRMLREAGIDRAEALLTNVFMVRPEENKIDNFLSKKTRRGDFLQSVKEEYRDHVRELQTLIETVRPNLIISTGAISTWALTGIPKISSARGTVHRCVITEAPIKVLPTYHPAAVLRMWNLRPIVVADLIKARFEARFPEIKRPKRRIVIEPDIHDLGDFYRNHIFRTKRVSVDIETGNGQILCLAFASDPANAIVIPFVDKRRPDYSYWSNPRDEVRAIDFVKTVLEDPSIEKVGQNGLYDIQWLWRKLGIRVANYTDDTMLLHHALQPELPKGLGFLGSVYTNEASWKDMRQKISQTKRDD